LLALGDAEVLVERAIQVPDSGASEGVALAHVGRERRVLSLPDAINEFTRREPAQANVVVAIGRARNANRIVIDAAFEVHRAAQNRAAANTVAERAIKDAKRRAAPCGVDAGYF